MFDLSVEGSVARLVLSRAEVRNAIPLDGWSELAATAERAVAEGARGLIVSGIPGGAFCAGADISDFGKFQEDSEARTVFRLAMRGGLDRLREIPVPTVALVEGACYGAGVALAMACDIRIAGGGAQFAITPAKLGISYPQEDVHRLVSLVGPGQAARLLFSAATIDGAEAARIALAELFMESGAAEAAAALAEAIAANDPESLRTLKRGVGLGEAGIRQDEGQDLAFDDLLGSEALARGLEAYWGRVR
ncbi:MAG TPA: enoyl-CoA hydratase/isomerase family protein [Allosphingosinicella sp.]|nr:enoyl-CoA hydratase/isomerase family protein [Allosphingosinicella sp.]